MWWTLCSVRTLVAVPALALLAASGKAGADVAQVPADYTTIQEAIAASADGDLILVAPGLYNEQINLLGKAITVRGAQGAETTIIEYSMSQRYEGSVVTFNHGEGSDTVFEGFTVSGGHALQGGGMLVVGSSPTILDCIFLANSADADGGGLCCLDSSNPQVTGCTFQQNVAGTSGGGAGCAIASSPSFLDCQFTGNIASEGGGGFFCAGGTSMPHVTDCTFVNNTAALGGGGMCVFLAKPVVENSLFDGNWGKDAGGIYHGGLGANGEFVNCTITNNVSSENGGGFTIFNCTGVLTNCLIARNEAGTLGGGLSVRYDVSLEVKNCTIVANAALVGVGMECGSYQGEAPNDVAVANSVFWNDGDEVLIRDTSTVEITYSDVDGGWPGIGNVDATPLFVDPDDGDFHLSSGSPCIDAADNAALPPDIEWDLDGNPRFHDDPGTPDSGPGDPPIVDMGAYEFQGTSCMCDCEAIPDGTVGVTDFLSLLAEWGGPGLCDFDGDGVGVTDFLILLGHWGPCS